MIAAHTTDKPAPARPRPAAVTLTAVTLPDGTTAYALTATA